VSPPAADRQQHAAPLHGFARLGPRGGDQSRAGRIFIGIGRILLVKDAVRQAPASSEGAIKLHHGADRWAFGKQAPVVLAVGCVTGKKRELGSAGGWFTDWAEAAGTQRPPTIPATQPHFESIAPLMDSGPRGPAVRSPRPEDGSAAAVAVPRRARRSSTTDSSASPWPPRAPPRRSPWPPGPPA
jgi:hypothetical protein